MMRSGVTCAGAAVAIGISSLPERAGNLGDGEFGGIGDAEECSSFSSEFGAKRRGRWNKKVGWRQVPALWGRKWLNGLAPG